MIDVKMNYSSDPKISRELWRCDSCMNAVEDTSHILHCVAYRKLREGKDMENMGDLASYYSEVMRIRNKMGVTV